MSAMPTIPEIAMIHALRTPRFAWLLIVLLGVSAGSLDALAQRGRTPTNASDPSTSRTSERTSRVVHDKKDKDEEEDDDDRRATRTERSDTRTRGRVQQREVSRTTRGTRQHRDDARHREDHRYQDRRQDHWTQYANPPYHRTRVHRHARSRWVWECHYEQRWAPRFRYSQVVTVDVGWGRHRRAMDLDIRTFYKQRIRYANHRKAEVELTIDRIEVYRGRRFLGYVEHIPHRLRTVDATIYRNGRIDFERDLFLVGDPAQGFELISTRYYDGYVLDRYERRHGFRVGTVSFRRHRVYTAHHSRFFDPYDFHGYAPIGLLPAPDVMWDNQYASYLDCGWEYQRDWHTHYSPQPDRRVRTSRGRTAARGTTSAGPVVEQDRTRQGTAYQPENSSPRGSTTRQAARRRTDDQTIRTERGATIRVQREAQLERVDS